jgi:acetyltransferase
VTDENLMALRLHRRLRPVTDVLLQSQLMGIHNLAKAFRPRSIAVVGASDRPASLGQCVFRNLVDARFAGTVVPVNWKRATVAGRQSYSSLDQLPEIPDLVVVCTPAETVPDLIASAGAIGASALIVLSAGFRETGPEGASLEEQVQQVRLRHPQLRVIGPNCVGIISPHNQLNASFAAGMPVRGGVAVLSQSGAIGTALLDLALEEGWGISHFVSVGNMIDVNFADYLDYFAAEESVTSVVVYLEGLPEARSFLSAARAFTRSKPIVVYKSGRFEQSARAATSHTGALAGSDAAFDAAFDRAGIVRVDQLDALFDVAEVLAKGKLPAGSRIAVVTNAGGPGIIAADALIAGNGQLATLSGSTLETLDKQLPRYWSKSNPIDILGDAPPGRYQAVLHAILSDANVDAVLVVLTPQAMTAPTESAEAVAALAATTCKPVIAVWMGGRHVQAGISVLNQHGVPTFSGPEHGVRALLALNAYRNKRELLYETPRQFPDVSAIADPRSARKIIENTRSYEREGSIVLSELESKDLLATFGIPIVPTRKATSAAEAVDAACSLGFPVALKVLSPEISHKSDVGGVQLNLQSSTDVEQAFTTIVANARNALPDCTISGVTVQPMVPVSEGIELILGAKRDFTFGMTVLIGAGGTTAECLKDVAIGLPPLNERLASRMLESLRIWPLLKGYRGRPAVDIDQLLQVMVLFSYLLAETPEVTELDVNPLWASSKGILALDARAVLRFAAEKVIRRPYGHLAIRPYPNQYQHRAQLQNGRTVLLRPIRPEDESRWIQMLETCSPETIRRRFRGMLRPEAHAISARFCTIDYDRELAIVAEIEAGADRELIGVGRMVADADHEQAEFAILVSDPWQSVGLGSILTEYCINVASDWGVSSLVADVDWNNERMLSLLRSNRFEVASQNDGIVRYSRLLCGKEAGKVGADPGDENQVPDSRKVRFPRA